jgi:hypothetical protein
MVRESHSIAREYELLHKYLRDRYANRVVLAFAQFEDLLGFSLPDLAWLQSAWVERRRRRDTLTPVIRADARGLDRNRQSAGQTCGV